MLEALKWQVKKSLVMLISLVGDGVADEQSVQNLVDRGHRHGYFHNKYAGFDNGKRVNAKRKKYDGNDGASLYWLRKNSAKDDVAGLKITSKMTAQVNRLNQAVWNCNDAISMIEVGQRALREVTNLL